MPNSAPLSFHYPKFISQVGQSPANLKNYTVRLRHFLKLYGTYQPHHIEPAHINTWYREISPEKAPATLAGYRQAVRALFNYLLRVDKRVAFNPAGHLRTGRYISTTPKIPPERDIGIVSAVAEHWQYSKKSLERRAATFWFWSLESGSRIDGLCNLLLPEFERGLRLPDGNGVYQFLTISKNKEVIIEVTQTSVHAALRWLETRPDTQKITQLLTTSRRPYNRMVTETACRDFVRISDAAKIGYTITSHQLRHRIGTMYTQTYDPKVAGMKLNHADAETTAATAIAYYYRPSRAAVSAATAALAPGRSNSHQPRQLSYPTTRPGHR